MESSANAYTPGKAGTASAAVTTGRRRNPPRDPPHSPIVDCRNAALVLWGTLGFFVSSLVVRPKICSAGESATPTLVKSGGCRVRPGGFGEAATAPIVTCAPGGGGGVTCNVSHAAGAGSAAVRLSLLDLRINGRCSAYDAGACSSLRCLSRVHSTLERQRALGNLVWHISAALFATDKLHSPSLWSLASLVGQRLPPDQNLRYPSAPRTAQDQQPDSSFTTWAARSPLLTSLAFTVRKRASRSSFLSNTAA